MVNRDDVTSIGNRVSKNGGKFKSHLNLTSVFEIDLTFCFYPRIAILLLMVKQELFCIDNRPHDILKRLIFFSR